MKLLKLACVFLLAASALTACLPVTVTTTSAQPTPAGGSTVAGSGSGSGSGNAGTGTGTGTATLSWMAPTTDTDGSALTDLAGYRIYYGTSADELEKKIEIKTVGIQTYVINDLGAGTWYFAVTAVTRSDVESAQSQIVSKTIS